MLTAIRLWGGEQQPGAAGADQEAGGQEDLRCGAKPPPPRGGEHQRSRTQRHRLRLLGVRAHHRTRMHTSPHAHAHTDDSPPYTHARTHITRYAPVSVRLVELANSWRQMVDVLNTLPGPSFEQDQQLPEGVLQGTLLPFASLFGSFRFVLWGGGADDSVVPILAQSEVRPGRARCIWCSSSEASPSPRSPPSAGSRSKTVRTTLPARTWRLDSTHRTRARTRTHTHQTIGSTSSPRRSSSTATPSCRVSWRTSKCSSPHSFRSLSCFFASFSPPTCTTWRVLVCVAQRAQECVRA